jgi:hypothetical protein
MSEVKAQNSFPGRNVFGFNQATMIAAVQRHLNATMMVPPVVQEITCNASNSTFRVVVIEEAANAES